MWSKKAKNKKKQRKQTEEVRSRQKEKKPTELRCQDFIFRKECFLKKIIFPNRRFYLL